MRILTVVLTTVLALGLAGCGPGGGAQEQVGVEQIKKFADKDVASLNAALDKNDHVTQACGRLGMRLRWLRQRQPDLDAQVKQEASDLADALERWSRVMAPGSPPRLAPEQIQEVRQLAEKANQVIERMTPK